MNKTKIDWCDYSWNPISGCKNGCFYCYGRDFRNRFMSDKRWEEIIENKKEWDAPLKLKKPSRIFVGSVTDMWAGWMPHYYKKKVVEIMQQCPQHIFYLLTKNPFGYDGEGIYKLDFPDNCWFGITVTQDHEAIKLAALVKLGKCFVSVEPILEEITSSYLYLVKWIIIGAMTGKYRKKYQPKIKWIENIIHQAVLLNIPIFMKENLGYVYKQHYENYRLRQEFPK